MHSFLVFLILLCSHAIASNSTSNSTRLAQYWLENIKHQGLSPFNPNASTYQVFRNVKDFGAKGMFTLAFKIRLYTQENVYTFWRPRKPWIVLGSLRSPSSWDYQSLRSSERLHISINFLVFDDHLGSCEVVIAELVEVLNSHNVVILFKSEDLYKGVF